MKFPQRVRSAITRHAMFPLCARIGVAVSGGADSVALLHVLLELRADWNLRLSVLHLNHCLRGAESDADEEFVRDLAARLALPFESERADIPAAAQHDNLEQAARNARRRFFRRLLESGSLDRIALGHTKSDQAETVLFRLLRGAYTTGLAGMRPATPDGLVRPLLDCTRSEVETYLKERNLPWREDSSNRDLRFTRNRIRHTLLPALQQDWNPNFVDLLATHAALAQDDEDYWAAHIASLEGHLLQSAPDGATLADIRELRSLRNAVLRRLLRRAIERIRGDLRQIESAHIQTVLDMVRAPEGHDRTQVPGVDILRSCDWIRFALPAAGPVERNFSLTAPIPGHLEVPGSHLQLAFDLIETDNTGAIYNPPTRPPANLEPPVRPKPAVSSTGPVFDPPPPVPTAFEPHGTSDPTASPNAPAFDPPTQPPANLEHRNQSKLIEREAGNLRDTMVSGLDWVSIQAIAGESGSLTLRNWRPGDAYRRIGDQHEQKLKNLFQEYRIPLWERKAWPLLTAGSRILWARRFGPAWDVAAGPSTTRLLKIREIV